MSGATPVDQPSAELALRGLGVRCVVESRGNLAILIPAPGERALEDATIRRTVLATLRAHGFTHAAVELDAEREPSPTADVPRA